MLAVYDGNEVKGIAQYCGVQSGSVIHAMEFYNDTLYVGGNFNTAPCVDAFKSFGKWNGTNTLLPVAPVFTQAPTIIDALAVFQNELYIGGWFLQQDGHAGNFIMKYDGQQFTSVGGGVNERVTALKVYNGELYVGGYFSVVDGTI